MPEDIAQETYKGQPTTRFILQQSVSKNFETVRAVKTNSSLEYVVQYFLQQVNESPDFSELNFEKYFYRIVEQYYDGTERIVGP